MDDCSKCHRCHKADRDGSRVQATDASALMTGDRRAKASQLRMNGGVPWHAVWETCPERRYFRVMGSWDGGVNVRAALNTLIATYMTMNAIIIAMISRMRCGSVMGCFLARLGASTTGSAMRIGL